MSASECRSAGLIAHAPLTGRGGSFGDAEISYDTELNRVDATATIVLALSSGGGEDRSIQVFLETERLVLRRFTAADVDPLVELDSDPDVMHFITGGKATPREIVQDEILPTFLRY